MGTLSGLYFAFLTFIFLCRLSLAQGTWPLDTVGIAILQQDTTICGASAITFQADFAPLRETTDYIVSQIPFSIVPYLDSNGDPIGLGVTLADDIPGDPPITMEFPFCFYGNTYQIYYYVTNGYISFSPITVNQALNWTQEPLPNPAANAAINGVLFPAADWYPEGDVFINYFDTGNAPFRKRVLTYVECPMFSCTNLLGTFQVVLEETTHVISNHIVHVEPCYDWENGLLTQGIISTDPNTFLIYNNRNAVAFTADNESIRYYPNGDPDYTITWFINGVAIPAANGHQVTISSFIPLQPNEVKVRITYGCSGNYFEDAIIVNSTLPIVNWVNPGPLCSDSPSLTLSTLNPGTGTWTIDGVPSVVFNPATLSTGSHNICYNECGIEVCQDITITELDLSWPHPGPQCIDNTPIILTDFINGSGIWTIDAQPLTIFDPSALGLGDHEVCYTACGSVSCHIISISDAASIALQNPPGPLCADDLTFDLLTLLAPETLSSGLWTGTGVSGTTLDLQVATDGLVTYTLSLANCGTASASLSLDIRQPPDAGWNLDDEIGVCAQPLMLSDKVTGTAGGSWQGEGITNETNGFWDPAFAGEGTILITYAVTDGPCIAQLTRSVNIVPCIFQYGLPNAFSPNGDGINEVYKLEKDPTVELRVFRIFNRWGTLVYEANAADVGWDGTYKGQPQDIGTYTYHLIVAGPEGLVKEEKGNFVLVR